MTDEQNIKAKSLDNFGFNSPMPGIPSDKWIKANADNAAIKAKKQRRGKKRRYRSYLPRNW